MHKNITTFSDTDNEKHKLHHRKNLVLLEDVDIEKIQVSSMVSLGEKNYKYFIGYKDDDHKTKSVCILLSKTSVYVRRYDGETKWMYFFIEDDEL